MAEKTKAQLEEEIDNLKDAIEGVRSSLEATERESEEYFRGHNWAEDALPALREVSYRLTHIRDLMWMKLSKPRTAVAYAEMAQWLYQELEDPCTEIKAIIEDAQ
jgi:septal ring factor EnvC (AmiA/AmiB activator)